MRAHGVLGDVQPSGDLVGAEVLVQEQQNLELARAQRGGDRVGHSAPHSTFANLLEESPRDLAREGCLAVADSAQKLRDPLGRLALEQVAGGATADRGQQVLFGSGSGEDDDLGLRSRLAQARESLEPAHSGHRKIEQHDLRPELPGQLDRLGAVGCLANDRETVLAEQRRKRVTRDGVVVHEQNPHTGLIGRAPPADKGFMRHEHKDDYQAWLWGEVLLIGLLGAALALFVAYPSLRNTYSLPHVRLVLDTVVLLVAGIVAVLAGIRFSVDGRRLDLFLCGGFGAMAVATLAFSIAPVLGNEPLHRTEAWAGIGGKLFAMVLIAAAGFSKRRTSAGGRALGEMLIAVAIVLTLSWGVAHQVGSSSRRSPTSAAATSRSC